MLLYSVPVPLHIVDHPLVHDALVKLRGHTTTQEEFRQAATRISLMLVAEAMRDVPTEPLQVHTPLAVAEGLRIGCDVVVVPVLRAGLWMLGAVLTLGPSARVGRIGFERDGFTAVAAQYFFKAPSRIDWSLVLVGDTVLAPGGQ